MLGTFEWGELVDDNIFRNFIEAVLCVASTLRPMPPNIHIGQNLKTKLCTSEAIGLHLVETDT